MGNELIALAVVLLATSMIMYDRRIRKLEKQLKELVEDLLGPTEYRCPSCTEWTKCPAASTAVSYPCKYFKRRDADGN